VTSPASLAYSASVVTRHHSYTIQMQRQRSPAVNLLDLPNELIEKILSYMDFKKVSNLRLVSALIPSLYAPLWCQPKRWLLNQ